MNKSPYEVLGISQTATADEIKAAYRALAKKYHPDRNQGDATAEERFKEIGQAYETLSKPQPAQSQGWTGDIFEQMFRNHPHFSQGFRPRNQDLNMRVAISLEQCFTGCEVEATSPLTGERHRVSIPAGIQEHQTMTIQGAGYRTRTDIPPGDMHIKVVIIPHSRFHREGDHLLTEVAVECFDAILGATHRMTLIDNTEVEVKIPPGCQPGTRLRIVGAGMMNVHVPQRGDLYVQINVTIPTMLSDRHRDAIKRLSEALPPDI